MMNESRPVVGVMARLAGIKQLIRDGQPINEDARRFLAEHDQPKTQYEWGLTPRVLPRQYPD